MRAWLLRIEGVNFAATLYDTQQLSCIRGAGLALQQTYAWARRIVKSYALPDSIMKIMDGASIAALRFLADQDNAAKVCAEVRKMLATHGIASEDAANGAPPFAHLSFVVDLIPMDGDQPSDIHRALTLARAHNRARQFRELTVRIPPIPNTHAPPSAGAPRSPLPADDKVTYAGRNVHIPNSVAARMEYGRKMRQGFYKSSIGAGKAGRNLLFTDSFEQICQTPPDDVLDQVKGKIAVLFFDATGLGRIIAKVGNDQQIGAQV